MTAKHIRSRQEPFRVIIGILSLLFGVLNVFGLQMYYMDDLPFFEMGSWLLITVFLIGGWAVLFYLAAHWIACGLEKLHSNSPLHRNRAVALFERHPFWVSFCVILLCWAPWVVAYYPASMEWDVYRQLCSALSWGKFARSNHDPWLSSCVLAAFYRLGVKLGNQNLGMFLFIFLRNLLISAIYSNCVSRLRRAGVRTWLCIAVLLFYAVTPVWGAYAKHAFKDTLSTALFCGYMTSLVTVILHAKQRDLKWVHCVSYIGFTVAAALFRNNPIYAILPTTVLLIVFLFTKKADWKKCLSLTLGVCIVFGFNHYIFTYGNVSRGSDREILSLPFQQTARTVKYHGDEITATEKAAINDYLDYGTMAKLYNPILSDPIKDRCKETTVRPDAQSRYLKTWISMLPKYLDTYVEAAVGASYGYYAFTPKLPDGAGNSNSGMTIFRGIDVPWFTEKYDFDFHYTDSLEPMRTALHAWSKVWDSLPVLSLTDTIAAYTWFVVLLGGVFLQKKKWAELIPIIAMGIMILTCIASPVNDAFRYYSPVAAAAPTLLLLLENKAAEKATVCVK